MDKNRDPWNHPKQKEMLKPEDTGMNNAFQKAPASFLINQEERKQMDKGRSNKDGNEERNKKQGHNQNMNRIYN